MSQRCVEEYRNSHSAHPVSWLTVARTAGAMALALGLAAPAQAIYIPTPQVGDVFSVAIDTDGDTGTPPDVNTTLTLNLAGSGTPNNSTLSPFTVTSGGQTFSFLSSPVTWFFGDADGSDGFSGDLSSAPGCTPGGVKPCTLSLHFDPTYTGTLARALGDSNSSGDLFYARLELQSQGQVPEPEMPVLIATVLALLGAFQWRTRRRASLRLTSSA